MCCMYSQLPGSAQELTIQSRFTKWWREKMQSAKPSSQKRGGHVFALKWTVWAMCVHVSMCACMRVCVSVHLRFSTGRCVSTCMDHLRWGDSSIPPPTLQPQGDLCIRLYLHIVYVLCPFPVVLQRFHILSLNYCARKNNSFNIIVNQNDLRKSVEIC